MYKKAKESGDVLGFLVKELSSITFMKSKYSRRKKQFLRGMSMRGGWNLPTGDPWFLEGPDQSTHIMNVVRRLGIAWKDMNKNINKFCDKYLKDRAVLSHALWVIGKKNCLTNSRPKCEECLKDVCSSADSFGPTNL